MHRAFFNLAVCGFIWHSAFFQQLVHAQGSLGESIDCTEVSVDYTDDPTLTREERLRLMDKAFVESLNRFELCQAARDKAKAKAIGGAGAGGGDGNGSNSGNGSSGGAKNGSKASGGEQGAALPGQSVASSTMSGTETPQEISPVEGQPTKESGAEENALGMTEAENRTNGDMTSSNGKLPEDIPPANNDDALAAQIRYAAENETDPVKSKQLWNEYRKYKGMAPKD